MSEISDRPDRVRNNRLLVVDDQFEIHEDFREILTPPRAPSPTDELASAFLTEDRSTLLPTFELLHARSGEEALVMVENALRSGDPIALAFVDIRMPPGIDGGTTVRKIREADPDIEFVIMTAYTDLSLHEIVENTPPTHKLLYVRKPFAREEIQQFAAVLVEKYNVEQQLKRCQEGGS